MIKTIDISELSEEQKHNLLMKYLSELGRIYRKRSDTARDRGEPITDLIDVLFAKQNDVEVLKKWVSLVIRESHAKRVVTQMDTQGSPQASTQKLYSDAHDALLQLDVKLYNLPPAKDDPSPQLVRTALDLLRLVKVS